MRLFGTWPPPPPPPPPPCARAAGVHAPAAAAAAPVPMAVPRNRRRLTSSIRFSSRKKLDARQATRQSSASLRQNRRMSDSVHLPPAIRAWLPQATKHWSAPVELPPTLPAGEVQRLASGGPFGHLFDGRIDVIDGRVALEVLENSRMAGEQYYRVWEDGTIEAARARAADRLRVSRRGRPRNRGGGVLRAQPARVRPPPRARVQGLVVDNVNVSVLE